MKRIATLVAAFTLFVVPSFSQEEGAKTADKKPVAAKPAPAPAFTPEREAAALSFVSQHHPELNKLLTQLRNSRHKEYQSAINELFRNSERLTQTKERNPHRYELELKVWKLDSRLRLIAAKLSMGENPALEAEAKELLSEKIALQLESQQLERQRLTNMLEKVDAVISKLEQSRDDQIDAAYDKLLGGIAASRPKGKVKPGKSPGKSAAVTVESKDGAGSANKPQK